MDENHLARLLFDIDEEIRRAERDLERVKQQRETLEQELARKVGVGGVVFIHDGATMVIVGKGARAVDKKAIDLYRDELPPYAQPRKVVQVKYPSVKDVENIDLPLIKLRSEDRPYSVRFRDASEVDFSD